MDDDTLIGWAERSVKDPTTTEAALVRVFGSVELSRELRTHALNHPRMTNSAVLRLADVELHGDMVRATTRRHAVLELLADDQDARRRAIVAFNPCTRGVTLHRLADDESALVRLNAGLNGNLARSVRVRLALHDRDPAVQDWVMWALTTTNGRRMLDGDRCVVDVRDDEPVHLIVAGFAE